MKKSIVLVLALMSALVSCGTLETMRSLISTTVGTLNNMATKSDREYAEETISAFIEAVKNGNSSKLASLFSKNVQNNISGFDESVTELLDFIEGDVIGYELLYIHYGSKRVHYDQVSRRILCTFSIETSSDKYYIDFSEYPINQFDINEEGIDVLFIINAENWHKETFYPGIYDKDKFGITIDRNIYTEQGE